MTNLQTIALAMLPRATEAVNSNRMQYDFEGASKLFNLSENEIRKMNVYSLVNLTAAWMARDFIEATKEA